MKGQSAIAVCARGLTKSYGSVKAVKKIDLELRRGEIYGFLGRNGAGKTTTVRMFLGLIRPDSGEMSVLGSSLKEDRASVLSRVGYLVEAAAAYPSLTVRENLDIQRRLTRSPKGAVGETMELMEIAQYADRKACTLSMGNKQRLSLARALLHKPELLILDEPINGLDPACIVEIRKLLRRLANDEGVTVFMSSHLLSEVEQLADRVGIVNAGVLVEEIDCRDFRAARVATVEEEVNDPEKAMRVLREELGMAAMTRSGPSSLRIADAGAEPSRIARALVNSGIALERLMKSEEDLETHFMRLTGGTA